MSTMNKPKQMMFDEEVTSVYEISSPPVRSNRFQVDMEVLNADEQYMVDACHTQSIAVEGRSAIAQKVTTEFGEMATHAALVFTGAVEQINRYATAAQVGRFEKQVQSFHNHLLDQTGRHIFEVNELAARSMYEHIRGPIVKPQQAPPRPKRKGVVPGMVAFLFGEQ